MTKSKKLMKMQLLALMLAQTGTEPQLSASLISQDAGKDATEELIRTPKRGQQPLTTSEAG
jgi:hypothetical protein